MTEYQKARVPDSPIGRYTHRLCTRRQWAKIGIVVMGICSLVSLAAASGLVWAKRATTISGATVIAVTVLCVYPFVVLASQVAEYRRVSDLLELLDVLERETRVQAPQDQQTVL